MLKALMKKQFLELNEFYFRNKRTGKLRSTGGIVGMILLYCFLFLMIGFSVFSISVSLAEGLVPAGLGWFYFAIMSLVTIPVGTFGSVFNTYATLYHAKDNDVLLSMPIPPSYILLTRMTGVFCTSMLYGGIVFVPATLAFYLAALPNLTLLSVINPILTFFLLSVLITVLTCALGWVVAWCAAKLKNKSYLTVLISLGFIGLYYYFYFNYFSLVENILQNSETFAEGFRQKAYPLFLFGKATAGDVPAMAGTAAVIFALAVACVYVLSRSYIAITTSRTGERKTVYKKTDARIRPLGRALLYKEWKRFSGSAIYLLNCGFGAILMVAATVAALIFLPAKIPSLEATLNEAGFPLSVMPVIGFAGILFIASTVYLTAPSISLEGKTIAILQTLPVPAKEVLRAKQKLHCLVGGIPALILTLVTSICFKTDVLTAVLMLIDVSLAILLSSAVGLATNLKLPNLTWTSEAIPVKQGMPIAICLFGSWILAVIAGAGGFFFSILVGNAVFLLLFGMILFVPVFFLNRWLDKRGAEIFASL